MERKLFSNSHLKWLAIIAMFIDHFVSIILKNTIIMEAPYSAFTDSQFSALLSCFEVGHAIGRLAMPIFAFLLVEGFLHTRNLKKYLVRLFIFALISEIPYDLAFGTSAIDFTQQNVFFTLFLALAVISLSRKLPGKLWLLPLAALAALAGYYLKLDGSYYGVWMVTIFYMLKDKTLLKCLSVLALQLIINLIFKESILTLSSLFAALPLIAIYFYNGKRGQNLKYFFYVFYPAHLLLLVMIAKFVITPFYSG